MKSIKSVALLLASGAMALAAQADLLYFKATSFDWGPTPKYFEVAQIGVAKNGDPNWGEGGTQVFLDLKLSTDATESAPYLLSNDERTEAGPAFADVSAYTGDEYTYYVETWTFDGESPVVTYAADLAKGYAALDAAEHIWTSGATLQSLTPWEVPEPVVKPEHGSYEIKKGDTEATVTFKADPGYSFADGGTSYSVTVPFGSGAAPVCSNIYYAGTLYLAYSTSGWNLYTDEACTTAYGDCAETWTAGDGVLEMEGFVHPGLLRTVPSDATLKIKGSGVLCVATNDATVAALSCGTMNETWVTVQGANPSGGTLSEAVWDDAAKTYVVNEKPAQKLVFAPKPCSDLTVPRPAGVAEVKVLLEDGEEIPANPDGTFSIPVGATYDVVFVAEDGLFFGGTAPTTTVEGLVAGEEPSTLPEELVPAEPIVHTHCICGKTGCDGSGHDTNQVWECTATLPTTAGYWTLTNDLVVSGPWTPADGTVLCLGGHTIAAAKVSDLVIAVPSDVNFTLTDCAAESGVVRGAMTGGVVRAGTIAGPVSGVEIEGGTFMGAVSNATIRSGVFTKPLTDCTLLGGCFATGVMQGSTGPGSGFESQTFGDWTVVGKAGTVEIVAGKVTNGTFLFDPSLPEYEETGLFDLLRGTLTKDETATPPEWTFTSTPSVFVSDSGSDILGDGTAEKPFGTLTAAYDALPARGGVIAIVDDLEAPIGDKSMLVADTSGKSVLVTTVDENGDPVENEPGDETGLAVIRRGSCTAPLISVTGGTVALGQVILDGEGTSVANPLVSVGSGATVSNGVNAVLSNSVSTGDGGAVNNAGTFVMTGGEIRDNAAANGGGIANSGTLTIAGGTIADNTAQGRGGAISGTSSYDILSGYFEGNTAPNGVCLCLNGKTVRQTTEGARVITVAAGRTFTLTDRHGAGAVSGGSCNAEFGSGVLVEGTFNFLGGAITGNGAAVGALVASGDGEIVFGGSAAVTNNAGSNVYLLPGGNISFSTNAPLAEGALISVTTATKPDYGAPVTLTTNGAAYAECFTCDEGPYYVRAAGEGLELATRLRVPPTPENGFTIAFDVGATNDGETVSYEWHCVTAAGDEVVPGATGPKPPTSEMLIGASYYCLVSVTAEDGTRVASFATTPTVMYHVHGDLRFPQPIATSAELLAFLQADGDGAACLTNDVALPADVTLTGVTKHLCLNGHVLDQAGHPIALEQGAKLALYECEATTPHYFTQGASGAWAPTDEVTENVVRGGYILGVAGDSDTPSFTLADDSQLTFEGGTLVGADTRGAVIALADESQLALAGGDLAGNAADGALVQLGDDSVLRMTDGEVRDNVAARCVLAEDASTAEITGGVLRDNDGSLGQVEGSVVAGFDEARVTLGGDAAVTNNATVTPVVYAEGAGVTLTIRDDAQVVENYGSFSCSGVLVRDGANAVVSGRVRVLDNEGGNLCTGAEVTKEGGAETSANLDFSGLAAGAEVSVSGVGSHYEAGAADAALPRYAAETIVVASNVTDVALACLVTDDPSQYLEKVDVGGVPCLAIHSRLVSPLSATDDFAFTLDTTGYEGGAGEGSVVYQWFPATTTETTVTDETPDCPETCVYGTKLPATFDVARDSWVAPTTEIAADEVYAVVGFTAKKGDVIRFEGSGLEGEDGEMPWLGGAIDARAKADLSVVERREDGTVVYEGTVPADGDYFLCTRYDETPTSDEIVVSDLTVTTRSVDYDAPIAGQDQAAFDFSKTTDEKGEFACVACFVESDGTTVAFSMPSPAVNYVVKRDADGAVVDFFDTPIADTNDLAKLCAEGGNGYLTADLAPEVVTTVAGDVKLFLDGHALDLSGVEGGAFRSDGPVSLEFVDSTNDVSQLTLGDTTWPYYAVKGPGVFPATVDPSLLDTSDGYQAFYNEDGSGWTAALAWPVVIDVSGTGAEATTNYVKRGEVIAKPSPDPVREGYAFGGWYTDPACTTPYDFTQPVAGDLKLYAKWVAPGCASVENANGELVAATNFADAVDKALNGGYVLVSNETVAALLVDKELVIAKNAAADVSAVTADATQGLVKTNSGDVVVVVGRLVDGIVTVVRDRNADVKAAAAPAGVSAEDWAVVSGLAARVQQSGIYEALLEATKTNLVQQALAATPGAEAVIVTVNLNVTPTDVKKVDGDYVKYTFDAQPVATVVSVKDGVSTTVAEGVALEAGHDFAKGSWFQVTLPCAGLTPVSVAHKLSDGSYELYESGDGHEPTDADPTLTFAHNAVEEVVTLYVQENSEFSVLAIAPTVVSLGYDAMGGAFEGGADALSLAQLDIETYALPTAPTRAGYEFAGWYDGVTNGSSKVEAGTAIGKTALYARWTVASTEEQLTSVDLTGVVTADGLAYTNVAPTARLAASGKTDLTIPDTMDDLPITEIKRNAFRPITEKGEYAGVVTRVKLGSFVVYVRPYAFYRQPITNVVFSVAHDYRTGEKTTLYVQDRAFQGATIQTLTFPAGGVYDLSQNAFRDVTTVEDVYMYGTLTARSLKLSPLRNIGSGLAAGKKVTFHLNPSQAADAAFVHALTNGMGNASVQLDEKVLGSVETGSFTTSATEIMVEFTPAADSPWQVVNEDTVYMLFSASVSDVVVGTGKVLRPTEVVRNPGGTYTATFDKPTETAGFFRLCVGE